MFVNIIIIIISSIPGAPQNTKIKTKGADKPTTITIIADSMLSYNDNDKINDNHNNDDDNDRYDNDIKQKNETNNDKNHNGNNNGADKPITITAPMC